MLSKDNVSKFISQYLPFGEEEIKVQSINSFVCFSKLKIEEDKEKIIKFFRENFDLKYGYVFANDFLYDIKKEKWLNIEGYNDIMLLESVIGLAIAVGFIEENYSIRTDTEIVVLKDVLKVKPEFSTSLDNLDFSSKEKLEDYINIYKNVIIREYKLLVKGEYVLGEQIEISDEEIKEILTIYWGLRTLYFDKETEEKFNDLLELNPKALLNHIVFEICWGVSPNVIAEHISSNTIYERIREYKREMREFSELRKIHFNKNKNQLIRDLRSIKRDNYCPHTIPSYANKLVKELNICE